MYGIETRRIRQQRQSRNHHTHQSRAQVLRVGKTRRHPLRGVWRRVIRHQTHHAGRFVFDGYDADPASLNQPRSARMRARHKPIAEGLQPDSVVSDEAAEPAVTPAIRHEGQREGALARPGRTTDQDAGLPDYDGARVNPADGAAIAPAHRPLIGSQTVNRAPSTRSCADSLPSWSSSRSPSSSG